MAYDQFQVLRVPFPFTDRDAVRTRPALVLSDRREFNDRVGHSVLAMITSASHSAWPLDTPLTELASAGLPRGCVVRFKLFTLDHRLVRGVVGRLGANDEEAVRTALLSVFRANGLALTSDATWAGRDEPGTPG